jgi:hypothetical protein
MNNEEDGPRACHACGGTGIDPDGYRADDYGPHYTCLHCDGSGLEPEGENGNE